MNRVQKVLILLSFFCFSFSASGITVTMTQAEFEANNKRYQTQIDSLQKQTKVLADSLGTLQTKIKSLEKDLKSRDTVINDKKTELINKEKELASCRTDSQKWQNQRKEYEQKEAFADTCIAKAANNCLYTSYDSSFVSESRKRFGRMSPQHQKDFASLRTLLDSYKKYNDEIKLILNDAQNDPKLKKSQIFGKYAPKDEYIKRLKNSSYYKNVYSSSWKIPYLNQIIDRSIKRLNALNPDKGKFADFSDLLETM